MEHILSLLPDELVSFVEKKGLASYRGSQLLNWIYNKQTIDFNKMTSLPLEWRDRFNRILDNYIPEIISEQTSTDATRKFLLELIDGNHIEMVLIPKEEKYTLCISSQIGCKRNCRFCATAKMGFIRNLTVGEMVAQVFIAQIKSQKKRLNNIVFMGMGEPFDNYANVEKVIKILQHEKTYNFGARRITISTSGVIPGIKKLSNSSLKTRLAISLNSAIQSKREKLMPISRQYSLVDLKPVLHNYSITASFKVTLEYVLIKNFNMGIKDARTLKYFAHGIKCKLNLIPWNEVKFFNFRAPDNNDIKNFIHSLDGLRAMITVRDSKGEDIAAACGQLAGRFE